MEFMLGNAVQSTKAKPSGSAASEADPNAKAPEAGKDFQTALQNAAFQSKAKKSSETSASSEELVASLLQGSAQLPGESSEQSSGQVENALLIATLLGDELSGATEVSEKSDVKTLPEGVALDKYSLLNGISDQSKQKAGSLASMQMIASNMHHGQIEESNTDDLQSRVAEVRGILNRHKNGGKTAGDSEIKWLIEKSLKPISSPATGTSKVPLYSLTLSSLVADLKNRGVSEDALKEIKQKLGGARVVMEATTQKAPKTMSTDEFLKIQQMNSAKTKVDSQKLAEMKGKFLEASAKNTQNMDQMSEYAALGTLNSYEPSTITIDAPLNAKGEIDEAALEDKVFKTVGKQSFFLINDKGGQLKIKLNPNGLGEINLMVKVENDQIDVNLLAENAGVRDFLKGKMDDLKLALGNQDLRLVNVTVESGSNTAGSKSGEGQKFGDSNQYGDSYSEGQDSQDGLNQWSQKHHRDLNADLFGGPGVLSDPSRNYQNVSNSIGNAA